MGPPVEIRQKVKIQRIYQTGRPHIPYRTKYSVTRKRKTMSFDRT